MQSKNNQGVYSKKPRRIALFDFDGTLVEAHLWAVLFKYNLKKKKRVLSSIWYMFYHMVLYFFSKIKLISQKKCFQAWAKDIPQLFKKTTREKGAEIFKNVWNQYIIQTSKKSVLEKLKWHKEKEHITFLVSNAPQEFLEVVKQCLNFDFIIGVKSEIKNNKFTGKIMPPLLWGKEKVTGVKKIIKEKNLNVDFKKSFAYSDSSKDLPMLKLVGNPVVVNPNEELLKIATKNNWEIIK